MTTTEFPIDLSCDMGVGPLFITDPRVLIRPPAPGQGYDAPHDPGHACKVLLLSDDMMRRNFATHIFCDQGVDEAFELLDLVFYAQVDGYQFRAIVEYIVGDDTVRTDEYGVEQDPDYTVHFYVYCNVPKGEPTETMLTTAIDRMVAGDHFVVARPDASAPDGYTAQGYTVDSPPNEENRSQPTPRCRLCHDEGCYACTGD